jgi:hypothetical protein
LHENALTDFKTLQDHLLHQAMPLAKVWGQLPFLNPYDSNPENPQEYSPMLEYDLTGFFDSRYYFDLLKMSCIRSCAIFMPCAKGSFSTWSLSAPDS